MSTLKVIKVAAGTELDGYDISFKVTVVGGDHDGTEVYSSRFADKAVMKAVVKTAEEPFLGWNVEVEPEVATAAGVRNLEQRVDAERFQAIRHLATTEFDAAAAVEMIKQSQG